LAGSTERVAEEVRRVAEGVVSPLGLEVVDVVFRRQGKYTLLRIDLDRAGLPGISLDDCERASRAIEPEIDSLGLSQDSFELQISSPGVERPIVTDDDVRRNTGRPVRVETSEKVQGAVEFRGVLRGLSGKDLRIESATGEEIVVPRRAVASARQDVEADLHAPAGKARSRGKRDRRGIVGGPSS
jgi:ribosome maturation factor RimP